jgi:hypothetical protein
VTPAVWNGLPPEVLPACRRAESAEEFAAAVVAVLSLPPHARRRRAAQARVAALAWSTRLAPLVDLLDSAARSEPSFTQARPHGSERVAPLSVA